MNAASLAWSVRLSPAGLVLADNLHLAEAQGFAAAWNRIEEDERQRAYVAQAALREPQTLTPNPSPATGEGNRKKRHAGAARKRAG
jgi:hypothetical protein